VPGHEGEEENKRLVSYLVPSHGSKVVCDACVMVLVSPWHLKTDLNRTRRALEIWRNRMFYSYNDTWSSCRGGGNMEKCRIVDAGALKMMMTG
jgi:hypothetical protein